VCLLVDVCLLRSLPLFSLPRQSAANEAAQHYAPEALRLVGYRPMMREYQDNVAGKAVGNYFSKVHFGLLIVHFWTFDNGAGKAVGNYFSNVCCTVRVQ
jgi:hypothetical protein